LFVDKTSPTGYSRWCVPQACCFNTHLRPRRDDSRKRRVQVNVTNDGQLGMNFQLAYVTRVPVHAVLLTYSLGTPEASQIYPPFSYVGNLVRLLDPRNATELAEISSSGSSRGFCLSSGCDFTLRATYNDSSQVYALLRGGFRAPNQPDGPYLASASDPLSPDSFAVFGVNLPGALPLTLVELLNTSYAAQNGAQDAAVLLSLPVP
jgi:hypothetical protein